MLHLAILTNASCSDKQTQVANEYSCALFSKRSADPFVNVGSTQRIRYDLQMGRVQIRLAKSTDCSALAQLRYQFRAETGSATESASRFVRRCALWMKKRLRSNSRAWRCWVLDDGKQLVGHVCVQVFEKLPNPVEQEPELHGYLTNFYVIPKMRGHGLGKRLLNKALSWCRAQGTDAIILWATPESRSLYRRCGFAEPADILELRQAAHSRRSSR
jgi:GNAT superfamily N-acetyltransferase